ncbi:MAG: succinate dehydrogenase iron-sulfur subunit [Deltaproteobacteria bacterium]|nr:succinate dehydrogenase iron-sulfur subunit [Deltaproteobacteria bacterium]
MEILFKIFRFDPDADREPRFQEYRVPHRKGLTVLDALFWIQDRLDPSLCFRSACRAAVCGSCAMHIGGRYRLACETQADLKGQGPVVVRPLAHLPVVRDLIVDMAPFFGAYKLILPYLLTTEDPPQAGEIHQSQSDRGALDEIIDCILCSSCYAACPMTGSDPEYLGPAALLQANRFLLDSRDDAAAQRLELVSDHHGIWRCHTAFNCSLACPKHLDPAGSIAHLKRASARDFLAKPFPK